VFFFYSVSASESCPVGMYCGRIHVHAEIWKHARTFTARRRGIISPLPFLPELFGLLLTDSLKIESINGKQFEVATT